MADAYARVSGTLGVCVTSTGTGAGNAAGALVEAITAGTPMLHLTGQIESDYLDRDLGFIHEAPAQLAMLQVGRQGRVSHPQRRDRTGHAARGRAPGADAALRPGEHRDPDRRAEAMHARPAGRPVAAGRCRRCRPTWPPIDALADRLAAAPSARCCGSVAARAARSMRSQRLVKLGFGVVTSVQGRGIVPEDHPATLGSYNLQKPVEDFYQTCDAMLVVGSRLRSNETLRYKLQLPSPLYRIDANALAHNRGYASELFRAGRRSASRWTRWPTGSRAGCRSTRSCAPGPASRRAREAGHAGRRRAGPLRAAQERAGRGRSTSAAGGCATSPCPTACGATARRCWTTRAPACMRWAAASARAWPWRIGTAVADATHALGRKTVALAGDGGFMLNLGELACAVQEKADAGRAADERQLLRRDQEHPGRHLRQPPLLCRPGQPRLRAACAPA